VASPAEHVARAEANEVVALLLEDAGHIDWAITVYFYVAVHYCTALLAHKVKSDSIGDHLHVQTLLDKHFPALKTRYYALFSASRRARYLPTHALGDRELEAAKAHVAEVKDYHRRVMLGMVPGVTLEP
jgi:hypothetical protein